VALTDKPGVDFSPPAGIKLIRIDPKTGLRPGPGASGKVIIEAFKPGTAPPDGYSIIGFTDADGRPIRGSDYPGGVSPESDRAIRSGTGGLY
jgi:penicillin-binding protein 1A